MTLYDATGSYEASPLLRCNIVYVPQGNTLMSGTIRDNLLLARPEATDAELREVLLTACAEFVFDLPRQMDTTDRKDGRRLDIHLFCRQAARFQADPPAESVD